MKTIFIISLVLILYNNNISYGECKPSLLSTNQLVPAMYVFGDSLVDSGNNNYLDTIARANYTPYGIDFPPGRNPTGRVTNGKTLADLFGEYLGLPYAPPYHMEPKPVDWLTGYNYASGSCGILPDTGIGNCSSLDNQVRNFEKTIEEELKPRFNEEELTQYLSNSIFLIIIGSNDYLVNYFSPLSNSATIYTPDQFADLLVSNLYNQIQELHRLGVRKAVVAEVGALGCLPKTTTRDSRECNTTKNEIVSIYNEKLAIMMQDLRDTFHDSYFTHARIYNLSYDVFLRPTHYGLRNSKNACCVIFPENGACIPLIIIPLCNRRAYYYFDGHHPTQAFYSIVANECITGSSTCLPYNLQQLARLQPNAQHSYQ